MNSNLDKFFQGIGEGSVQSSSQESRRRDLVFFGPDKRDRRETRLRQQQINESAKTVIAIVSIWTVIFVGMVIAAAINR